MPVSGSIVDSFASSDGPPLAVICIVRVSENNSK